MATCTNKISVRIDAKDLAEIQGNLYEFGCKSVSDFLRLAATEKLERIKLSSFVAEHIDRLEIRQKLLDQDLNELLKAHRLTNKNAVEVIKKIGDDLAILTKKIG